MAIGLFDCEANGLLETVTKIHCVSIQFYGQREVYRYVGEHVDTGLAVLDECSDIAAHNGFGYDYPALWKVRKWKPKARMHDTLILSQLVFSDNLSAFQGVGHSIESWGEYFNVPKVGTDITDWSVYTENMGLRCDQDVRILARLWWKLMKDMKGWDWKQSVAIEYQFARDFAVQGMRGVYVNQPHTSNLAATLQAKMTALQEEVEPHLPPKPANKGQLADLTPKGAFKKDGTPNSHMLKWWDSIVKDEHGWWGYKGKDRFKLPRTEPIATHVAAQLGDQEHIKLWLMESGWEPTMWSYKKEPDKNGKMRNARSDGSVKDRYGEIVPKGELIRTLPKFHDKGKLCENLEAFQGFGHAAGVVHWVIARHRLGVVNSILEHTRPDGRVTAGGMSLGTPTARVTHMVVANIPTAEKEVLYGKDCRMMFAAPEGRLLVGADAAGLELRQLAHEMNDATFTESVLHGDKDKGTDAITVMWKLIEEYAATRKIGKPTFYGWLYGASDAKIGQTAGHSGAKAKAVGAAIRATWLARFPALEELLERLGRQVEQRGCIVGLDGRLIPSRSKHSVLNTRLQSSGSICVKFASNDAERAIRETRTKAMRVIHYHDEGLWEVADEAAGVATAGFFKAGLLLATETFKLRCPLDSDFKIGKTWADVH